MSTAVLVPQAGESISEGELGKWLKTEGAFVEVDEIIAEIETEKASMEVRAPVSGILSLKVAEGSVVEVGKEIAEIAAGEPPADAVAPVASQPTATPAVAQESAKVVADEVEAKNANLHATPAARKLLHESGTPLSTVTPSGPAGRVNHEDVKNAIAVAAKANTAIVDTTAQPKEAPQPLATMGNREVTKKRMSMLRRTVASRLSEAQKVSALLTTFNEVDMAAVMKLRKKYKERFKETHDTSLGFMSFFTKAACHALQKFPIINSRIEGEDVLQYHYCDIGVAVSTEKGLVVPAIRNAETMSFAEIEKSILSLAQKGKTGKLTIEELSGGTFTITNGGIFGSMLSTPIVNYPQSAILGMHNIVERPVVVDGEIAIRPIMYVALTYDHRLIDGAQAVRFLYTVKEMIEDPNRLLLAV